MDIKNNQYGQMRGVGGVILDIDGRWLIQHHIKHNKLSLPGGKIEGDETVVGGLCREMMEELDIEVLECSECGIISKRYDSIHEQHAISIYLIESYSGLIKNVEPNKHSGMEWLFPSYLRSLHHDKLSDTITIALSLEHNFKDRKSHCSGGK